MTKRTEQDEYLSRLAAESRKWGDHLDVEASGEWNAWLDHPLVLDHYRRRSLLDGQSWKQWVKRNLGGPASRSLDLGCGAGQASFAVYEAGASARIEGIDISEDRVAQAEKKRTEKAMPGEFRVMNVNAAELEVGAYDLIFSSHSFHHFLDLERIMEQVGGALTARGLFVLEEFVGPTQFQWTDAQIEITRAILKLLPQDLRRLRWGAIKEMEGRPTPAEVEAVSPFEAIRSSEIFALFRRYFDIIVVRNLGGTIQHLLYNGIVHNFRDDQYARYVESIINIEDALIDSGSLPSDFMLLIGRKRSIPEEEIEMSDATAIRFAEKESEIELLRDQLAGREAEIEKIKSTLGWRLLSRYGRIKHRYLLPVCRRLGLIPDERKGG